MKTLIDNKKAYFNFEVLDKYEAGIILEGWEVKSLKSGRGSISGSYIKIKSNEIFLIGATIAALSTSISKSADEEKRDRKILLHKNQIAKILLEIKKSGITAVPLEIYSNEKGIIKIVVGLVKGKKKFDKRNKLKEEDIKRRLDQDRKKYNF